MTAKERAGKAVAILEECYPSAECALRYEGEPWKLLVMGRLSAQCTDKRVNLVTPALFEAYPTPADLAKATKEEVLGYIHSVSYPNAKAEHLVQMAQRLCEVYHGEVPDSVEELQTLSGVGRKTANVVCAVIWNQPTMAVDTHIFRISERLGLTTHSKSPLQTERQLEKHIPTTIIPKARHWLLLHGRYICQARRPKCEECGLTVWCRYHQKNQLQS